jgi:hypothetical protein
MKDVNDLAVRIQISSLDIFVRLGKRLALSAVFGSIVDINQPPLRKEILMVSLSEEKAFSSGSRATTFNPAPADRTFCFFLSGQELFVRSTCICTSMWILIAPESTW